MFMRARLVLFVLPFLLLSILPAAAQQAYPIGRIVALEGEASFGTAPAHVEDPVYMYNTITTGQDSKVLVLLIDDTQLTLGENSELTFDEFVFDPYDAEENKARVSVARGAFKWVSGMISKRKEPDVKINTAYGAIGIRGTIIWGGRTEGGYGVFVQEGEALVQALIGDGVAVPAGTGTIIPDKQAAPRPANVWKPARIDDALRTVTFRDKGRAIAMVQNQMLRNIERRHEYRKIMWPYKPQRWSPPSDIEDTRSRDFREQPQRHEQRMREHDQRMRDGLQQ